ncbi:uncharacterized protein [Cherax quadricarinatus]
MLTLSLIGWLFSCLVSVTSLWLQENGSFQCYEEGRFADPTSWGDYIDCVPEITGGLTARPGSCKGAVYNQKLMKCLSIKTNHFYEEISLRTGLRQPRSVNPGYLSQCSDIVNGFVCADCETQVMCMDGIAIPETCRFGDFCDMREEKFGGGVCYPRQNTTCSCIDNEYLRADFYDEQKFLYCKPSSNNPDVYRCSSGMRFSEEDQQCIYDDRFSWCTDLGVFANTNNCTQYYSCVHTDDGWLRVPHTCSNDYMYNEDTNTCEDPCTWPTGNFVCSAEGRYPDPLDCGSYFVCVTQGDGFRQLRSECPLGYSWVTTEVMGQGMCVDTKISGCTPVKVSRCLIPEGRCITSPPDQEPPVTEKIQCMKECDPSAVCVIIYGQDFCACPDGSNVESGVPCAPQPLDCVIPRFAGGDDCLFISNNADQADNIAGACEAEGGEPASLTTAHVVSIQEHIDTSTLDQNGGVWVSGNFKRTGPFQWPDGSSVNMTIVARVPWRAPTFCLYITSEIQYPLYPGVCSDFRRVICRAK